MLSYELKPVELGQAGEGIAGGLQVEAGVLHDVILLLLSNSKNLAGMASTAISTSVSSLPPASFSFSSGMSTCMGSALPSRLGKPPGILDMK